MIAIVISIVATAISLAGILFGIGYWRGKVDNELKWLKEKCQSYSDAKIPDRVAKMEAKFELVWEVFTEQVLTDRPHLATRQSPLKLTAQALEATAEVRACLELSNHTTPSDKVLVDVPAQIGLVKLKDIANRHSMTLAELLAIISLELSPSEDDCGKTSET